MKSVCETIDSRPVYYFGWTGYQNLGDEALYQAAHELTADTIQLVDAARLTPVPALSWAYLNLVWRMKPQLGMGIILGGGTFIFRSRRILRTISLLPKHVPRVSLGTGGLPIDFLCQANSSFTNLRDA